MSNVAVYTKQQEGDSTLFQVTPAHYPKGWAFLAIGTVLLLTIANHGAAILLILAGGCFWFGFSDPRPLEHQQPSTFRVRPAAIEAGAGTFKKADIEQITIKTGYESNGLVERIGAVLGRLQKIPVDQVTGSLVVRSKGYDYPIAGGLDPKTAPSLLSEVNELLGTGQQHVAWHEPVPGADVRDRTKTWDHFVLPPDIKSRLQEACTILRDAKNGIKNGARIPPILLYGPPGTGKTAIARTIASESGVALVATNSRDLRSRFVGESVQLTRRLFEKAYAMAPVVLFIDEFEGVARRRGTGDDPEGEEIVTQMLVEMDRNDTSGRPVFILAATNWRETLDPALLALSASRSKSRSPTTRGGVRY